MTGLVDLDAAGLHSELHVVERRVDLANLHVERLGVEKQVLVLRVLRNEMDEYR